MLRDTRHTTKDVVPGTGDNHGDAMGIESIHLLAEQVALVRCRGTIGHERISRWLAASGEL